MEKVRLDKWLWAVRIFKSRSIATKLCKTGKIKVNGKNAKPSTGISVNDKLEVLKNGIRLQIMVDALLSKRVGAPIARECYQDITPEEEKNKFNAKFIHGYRNEVRDKGLGRPTKKEGRDISEFKQGGDWDSFFESLNDDEFDDDMS